MKPRGPVFVVGMNGSGTTMLADSLGMHPGLYMMPQESKVLPYFIRVVGRYGDLRSLENRKRLARDIGRSKGFWGANGKRDVVLSDDYLGEEGLAGVIHGLYRQLASTQGKERWGDKSPTNTLHIAELADLFPSAQFVHIVRDARDAARSFHRRWRYDPLHTVTRWKRAVRSAQLQGRALGSTRYLEVTYESLTADPPTEMKRVCDFLGLDFDGVVLKSSMRQMDPANPAAASGEIIENSGKWQDYFSDGQIRKMEAIAGQLLASFGYRVTHQGDHSPGVFTRTLWILKDAYAATASFFRRYGASAWPIYVRKIKESAKQFVAGMQ